MILCVMSVAMSSPLNREPRINHTLSCFYGILCPNDDKKQHGRWRQLAESRGGTVWQETRGCRSVLTAHSARHPNTPIRIESHQVPQRSPQVEINLAATPPGPSTAAPLPTTAPHLQSGTHPGDEPLLLTTTHHLSFFLLEH